MELYGLGGGCGGSGCVECPRGAVCSKPELPAPEWCPVGHYNPDVGSQGKSSCRQCEKGKFQPEPGQSECVSCSPGTFSASKGQTTCELCPAGKFTDERGSTACHNCTSGYLCVEGSSAPQPCPGGTHAGEL